MIDPYNITNYNRTDFELQEWAIFCVMVAGKKSEPSADYADLLVDPAREAGLTPFDYYKKNKDELEINLREIKCGQYTRITKAIEGLLELDLRTCSVDDLLAIKGIGFKTSRFFMLHSRRNITCAVIDTHVLKFLKEHKVDKVPDVTPTSKNKYVYLEKEYLKLAHKLYPNKPLAEVDLEIWSTYRAKK